MDRRRPRASRGFTLVELAITAAIMSIIALAIGVVIVDSQTSWNVMYERVNGDVVTDGYVARKKFDAVLRQASRERLLIGDGGGSVEVYYYSDGSVSAVDRYARFYTSDGDLNFEYGQLDPRTTLGVETVCANVSACTFVQAGRSVQMILALNDGKQTNTVVSSAMAQNQ